MLRKSVEKLVALGPLPDSHRDEASIEMFRQAIEAIKPPLTTEEAQSLLDSFGSDDCFGLAWTLVHLIETAPGQVFEEEPDERANEWVRLLWNRAD